MSLARSPKQYTGVRPINPPNVIYADRAPLTTDTAYVKGDLWLDVTNQDSYQYAGAGYWIALGTNSTGAVDTLTGGSGGAISPSAGNITLAGTASQITTTGTAATITFSIPAAFVAPGSITATTTVASTTTMTAGTGFTATTGNIVATAGAVNSGTTMTCGTGLTVTTGGILVSGGDIINTHSSAAADVTIEVTNSDNTDPASRAGFEVAVGGASAGDPYVNFLVSGAGVYTMGIDNSSTNDDFVLSKNAAIGTSNVMSFDGSSDAVTFAGAITSTAGAITATAGNVVLAGAATQLQVEGGAVTDFIGQATLVAGTVTVLNTNIAATDRIFVTRSDASTSTALGVFDVSISAGASFTIDARNPTDATVQTNDVSVVDYFIVRQL